MALNKPFLCPRSCGLSQMKVGKEGRRSEGRFFVAMDIGSAVGPCNELSLISSLEHHDGVPRRKDGKILKWHASAPFCQVRSSEAFLSEDLRLKLVNRDGSSKHVNQKLIVAVDVDEVLGSFLSALNKFIADRYSSNHSVAEYFVYEFFKIWKCSRAEADIRVHEFFKTSYFKSGIFPIPGARHTLRNLSTFCNLSVVTSRQNAIKDHTLEWIEEHYPGLFQEIHFGNHFALDGVSRPKSEICRSLGAHVLIDDNPKYALECAEIGIRVLLFDYDNSYPWCKSCSSTSHPLVTKVHNWQEVELQLLSWVPRRLI
ncbi:uncharacterized protein LOC122051770 isoform X1 [Zingiber officinale]|nr:uncharacterized protein LOC122051770 isoform X1 [Zingiber officinale]XP_042468978.1 uncharacterized protein LOC122051770 isoform X1 [Zingiber officinale]